MPSIADFPLVLAGPILRHTAPEEVTAWVAIKEPRSLVLEVYETVDKGEVIGRLVATGQRHTIPLGQNLHIVAVTAYPEVNSLLRGGNIYAYNLVSKSDRQSLLGNLQQGDRDISYFPHQLPTFALPPEDLNNLKIVHGSCRKPHGGGKDALCCLDNLIRDHAREANQRPHQLFLTGDQIYGDDVADSMLWLVQKLNQLLFGWSEELPLKNGTISAEDLSPGKRSEIARIEGGFTAMLRGNSDKAKSHLFSFGEYAVAYLLAWSPVLMPDSFFEFPELLNSKGKNQKWQQEINHTRNFFTNLKAVRRALANVPVYTICDDHDISDDWYLNREWCDRVLSKPLGKRAVQNGLLAYVLFQAWGNTPKYFQPATPGAKLLQLAVDWLQSQGKNDTVKHNCDRYLGIPDLNPETGLPKFKLDRELLILERHSETIPWHYTIRSQKHEVIVLDTRTWRGYPQGKDKGLEPPMLLCPQAFKEQLQQPLAASNPEIAATIVVLPTNLVALGIIDRIQQFELSRNRVFSSDVGDSWNFHPEAFATMLLTLCQQRDRVIILSGDIHYSCAVRLTHEDLVASKTSVVVQLTSSAIKNSELATRLAHTKIKNLFPEKTERLLGWNQPLKIRNYSWWRKHQPTLTPDWQYFVRWYPRQPAQYLPWQFAPSDSQKKPNWRQKLLEIIINYFWRDRWLQEGSEVVGRNNLSLVRLQWQEEKKVIQETFWHSPWDRDRMVKSCYEISLELEE